MSSAASSALFYAARVADVPAVFMAEPDDVTVLSGENTHKHTHTQAAAMQVVDLSWTTDTLFHMPYSAWPVSASVCMICYDQDLNRHVLTE